MKVHPARKDELTKAYEDAYLYAANHDIRIFNATRGGLLEVFPRIDLDIVLSE